MTKYEYSKRGLMPLLQQNTLGTLGAARAAIVGVEKVGGELQARLPQDLVPSPFFPFYSPGLLCEAGAPLVPGKEGREKARSYPAPGLSGSFFFPLPVPSRITAAN